ncbi:MAG TPA: hypothetical protein VFC54_11670 [Pseudolabrys sp.]|nr:hypothetical protein [Pseudolabrys sp.]
MSNTEPMPAAIDRFQQGADRFRPHSPAQARRAPFPPLIEQAILFGFFAGGAAFWMAVIWWILR